MIAGKGKGCLRAQGTRFSWWIDGIKGVFFINTGGLKYDSASRVRVPGGLEHDSASKVLVPGELVW